MRQKNAEINVFFSQTSLVLLCRFCCIYMYMWDPNLVTTVPAHVPIHNSTRPSAGISLTINLPRTSYICVSKLKSLLFQLMPFYLFNDKPLSEPSDSLLLGQLATNFSAISIKIQLFLYRKWIWKFHLKIALILSWPQCVKLNVNSSLSGDDFG